MEQKQVTAAYTEAVRAIKEAILESRYRAARLVNKEILALYYAIGGYISVQSRAARWGSNGHREIVGEAIVADALSAATGGQHVDGCRRVGHRQSPKGPAVERSDDHEQQQGGGRQVACEENGKCPEAHHQHRAAREGVDEITAEGAEQQGRHRIARQHQPDHVLRGTEVLAQIERQQGRQHVEGEEQRKVCRHHLTVVPVPQPVHTGDQICGKSKIYISLTALFINLLNAQPGSFGDVIYGEPHLLHITSSSYNALGTTLGTTLFNALGTALLEPLG